MTLEVDIAPNGNLNQQAKMMLSASVLWAYQMRAGKLSCTDACIHIIQLSGDYLTTPFSYQHIKN